MRTKSLGGVLDPDTERGFLSYSTECAFITNLILRAQALFPIGHGLRDDQGLPDIDAGWIGDVVDSDQQFKRDVIAKGDTVQVLAGLDDVGLWL